MEAKQTPPILQKAKNYLYDSERKKQKRKAVLVPALLAFGLAFLLHFAYEFLGENLLVGFFVPVNESVWEHLKLAFYPVVLVMLYPMTDWQKNLTLRERLQNASIASFLAVCVVLFGYYGIHTGLGIQGKIIDTVIDIGLLLVGDLIGCYHGIYSCKMKNWKFMIVFSGVWLISMTILFWWFTGNPGTAEVFRIPE